MTQPLVDWETHGDGFPHEAGACELCDGLREHKARALEHGACVVDLGLGVLGIVSPPVEVTVRSGCATREPVVGSEVWWRSRRWRVRARWYTSEVPHERLRLDSLDEPTHPGAEVTLGDLEAPPGVAVTVKAQRGASPMLIEQPSHLRPCPHAGPCGCCPHAFCSEHGPPSSLEQRVAALEAFLAPCPGFHRIHIFDPPDEDMCRDCGARRPEARR